MQMKIQIQPNKWSCLPTAFAIATGIPIEKIIEYVGHDGSDIIFPEYEEPYCRRSFHPQELIDVCLQKNFMVVPIEKQPKVIAKHSIHNVPMHRNRMSRYLLNYTGVLVGMNQEDRPHAVAWDGNRVLDPNGTEYHIIDFTIETIFLIVKFNITK